MFLIPLSFPVWSPHIVCMWVMNWVWVNNVFVSACPTSWVTGECPVRNHISVLLRTDTLIQSLFLSGMHQWIVHQFTTYFPMRCLSPPPPPHFPSLHKAGFEKRGFGVSREATGEQIPTDARKKNSFKRACNTTVNCIREKNAMIKSEMFVWR